MAMPIVLVIMGFASTSQCDYDCWDQGGALWLMGTVLSLPLAITGAFLQRVWTGKARVVLAALMGVAFVAMMALYFLP